MINYGVASMRADDIQQTVDDKLTSSPHERHRTEETAFKSASNFTGGVKLSKATRCMKTKGRKSKNPAPKPLDYSKQSTINEPWENFPGYQKQ